MSSATILIYIVTHKYKWKERSVEVFSQGYRDSDTATIYY